MINFSTKENLSRLINIEKISLNSYLTIQKSLNKQILSFLKSFVSDIKIDLEYDSDNILFSLLNEASSNLKKNNENIKKLEKLLKKLDKLNDKSISKLKVSFIILLILFAISSLVNSLSKIILPLLR